MQLEDYFEFLASDDICLKGTRIGIEHILDVDITLKISLHPVKQIRREG